jgi:hypothetical protein
MSVSPGKKLAQSVTPPYAFLERIRRETILSGQRSSYRWVGKMCLHSNQPIFFSDIRQEKVMTMGKLSCSAIGRRKATAIAFSVNDLPVQQAF